MEDVLFDLSIAEAEMNDRYMYFGNDSLRRQQWLNSVFEKHRITEADFDTSLVWYNNNMDNFLKVNQRVTDRLQVLADRLTRQIDRKNQNQPLHLDHPLEIDSTWIRLQSPDWYHPDEQIPDSVPPVPFKIIFRDIRLD
jgi:hypothetical protein